MRPSGPQRKRAILSLADTVALTPPPFGRQKAHFAPASRPRLGTLSARVSRKPTARLGRAARITSKWSTTRPDPLRIDERVNPGCNMYELPVIRPSGAALLRKRQGFFRVMRRYQREAALRPKA